MQHARQRIKKDNPEAVRQWNEAIRELSKGDHYILILCNEGLGLMQGSPSERPRHDFLKLLLAALALVAIVMSVMFAAAHYGIGWKNGPKTSSSMPKWLQQLLLTLLVLGVARYLVKSLGTSSGPKKEK